jgi:hypothetical protein
MSIFKRSIWTAASLAIPLLWYSLFEWRGVDYPSYNKGPCYSPNHAYYITRHQTLWESLGVRFNSGSGSARLFDRSGKLLYEGETLISEEFGPEWFNGSGHDSSDHPAVFYLGNSGTAWLFTLPDSPGKGIRNRSCYPVPVE